MTSARSSQYLKAVQTGRNPLKVATAMRAFATANLSSLAHLSRPMGQEEVIKALVQYETQAEFLERPYEDGEGGVWYVPPYKVFRKWLKEWGWIT